MQYRIALRARMALNLLLCVFIVCILVGSMATTEVDVTTLSAGYETTYAVAVWAGRLG